MKGCLLYTSGFVRRPCAVYATTKRCGNRSTRAAAARTIARLMRPRRRAVIPVSYTHLNQNNEIGMPNTLFRLDKSVEYAVVEMGMQGLGEKMCIRDRRCGHHRRCG